MNEKTVSALMLMLLLIGIVTLVPNIPQVESLKVKWTVDDDGPANFHTIQEAINAASDGDSIFVYNGTYYENVVVNKTVRLTGEERSITFINGEGMGSVVHVTADNVHISGFTMQYSGEGLFDGAGVFLDYSNGSIIENNRMYYNERAILVWHSHGNTLRDNILRFSNDGYTFYVWYSTNNSIVSNSIYYLGVGLVQSGGNTFRNNEMYQFSVSGLSLADYINDVDTSNTVKGKPIYYWINQHNKQIPADAGVVVVVNSTGIVVKDLRLIDVGDGMVFAYTNNSLITNIVSQGASYGIRLDSSNNNIVSDNKVSNDMLGIFLKHSENNTLNENTAEYNSWAGLFLGASSRNSIHHNLIRFNEDTGISLEDRSTNNTIVENTIAHNGFVGEYYPAGISSFNSPNNTIYHNNLINNKEQVSRHSGEVIASVDVWDDAYPSGGNYWSDYSGTDLYNGPYQNETGSDGIGDAPHIIDEDNQDHYPLMEPWAPKITIISPLNGTWYHTTNISLSFAVNETASWIGYSLDGQTKATITRNTTLTELSYGSHNITLYANDTYGNMGCSNRVYFNVTSIADLNCDHKVDIQDIAIAALSFGSFPEHPRWNPIADINQDDHVDVRDVALTSRHFGETYT